MAIKSIKPLQIESMDVKVLLNLRQRQIDCGGLAAPSPITRLNYIFAALLAGGESQHNQTTNKHNNQSINRSGL